MCLAVGCSIAVHGGSGSQESVGTVGLEDQPSVRRALVALTRCLRPLGQRRLHLPGPHDLARVALSIAWTVSPLRPGPDRISGGLPARPPRYESPG